MYCTLWEEFKQTKALMWYYSPTKHKLIYIYDFWLSGQYGKYNSNIFLFHPKDPFHSKIMRCPWILCFDLLPLEYTDLTHEIWRFLVYIFLAWNLEKLFKKTSKSKKKVIDDLSIFSVYNKHRKWSFPLYKTNVTNFWKICEKLWNWFFLMLTK